MRRWRRDDLPSRLIHRQASRSGTASERSDEWKLPTPLARGAERAARVYLQTVISESNAFGECDNESTALSLELVLDESIQVAALAQSHQGPVPGDVNVADANGKFLGNLLITLVVQQ